MCWIHGLHGEYAVWRHRGSSEASGLVLPLSWTLAVRSAPQSPPIFPAEFRSLSLASGMADTPTRPLQDAPAKVPPGHRNAAKPTLVEQHLLLQFVRCGPQGCLGLLVPFLTMHLQNPGASLWGGFILFSLADSFSQDGPCYTCLLHGFQFSSSNRM